MHQHSATILAGALDGFGPWLYAILFSLCPLLAVAWVLRGHGPTDAGRMRSASVKNKGAYTAGSACAKTTIVPS